MKHCRFCETRLFVGSTSSILDHRIRVSTYSNLGAMRPQKNEFSEFVSTVKPSSSFLLLLAYYFRTNPCLFSDSEASNTFGAVHGYDSRQTLSGIFAQYVVKVIMIILH